MSASHGSRRADTWMSRLGGPGRLWVVIQVTLALVAGLVMFCPAGVEIVATAAGIPKDAKGVGGFVAGAQALVNPLLVMVAAVAPLCLIAGGLILLFGGRRGMQIIGTSLGVLLLLGSVTAIIN